MSEEVKNKPPIFTGPHTVESKQAIGLATGMAWQDPKAREKKIAGIRKAINDLPKETKICQCGCEESFEAPLRKGKVQKYIKGHWRRPTIGGLSPKDYWKQLEIRHQDDIKFFIQNRISDFRLRARKTGQDFDLTVDYLVRVYEGQQGLCFYTGEKMVFNHHSGKPLSNSLSIDRVDPIFGYTKGNVVWCCFWVNTMKGNMPYEKFFENMVHLLAYGDQT